MTPTPRLVPDRPRDAAIANAVREVASLIQTEAFAIRGANTHTPRIIELCQRLALIAREIDANALAHPSRGVVDEDAVKRALAEYNRADFAWVDAMVKPVEARHRFAIRAALQAAALPAVPVDTSYRLLTRADTVQSGDEVLGDDTVSWKPLAGWERGLRYDPALFMPARRMLAATPAQEGRDDG